MKKMKFKELPKFWKNLIIGLNITNIGLFILLVCYIWSILGDLIKVMF